MAFIYNASVNVLGVLWNIACESTKIASEILVVQHIRILNANRHFW